MEKIVTGDKEYKVVNGTYYDAETNDEVIRILENARMMGQRVRLFYGDVNTGRDWLETYDTLGHLARTGGNISSLILIKKSNSHGGGLVLTNCIVKITIDKKVVYQHPNYHMGNVEITDTVDEKAIDAGLLKSITINSQEQFRFKTKDQAMRHIRFLKGEINKG